MPLPTPITPGARRGVWPIRAWPARIGGVTRDGKALTLVLAGPFDTRRGLEDGLRQVRGMGFGQAVPRR